MREMHLLYFTNTGEKTALRIATLLSVVSDWNVRTQRGTPLNELVPSLFKRGSILVFIGAIGIAVRAVAPLLQSKTSDPPVIVVDEQGHYVIPILSGHVGGANRIAERIASLIGAVTVITTATDIHGVFAVDTFAIENGYAIVNPEMIKFVSAGLLEDMPVGLSVEYEIEGDLPKNIVLQEHGDVGIYIGTSDKKPFDKTLHLLPKCFHVGIGAKRNIAFDALRAFFVETLQDHVIPIESIGSISSIAIKQDEEAINMLASRHRIPFRTYTVEELQQHERQFDSSEFVRSKTGVGNVCETSAWISSKKGKIVLGKTIRSGMTMAIAKEDWRIRFSAKEVDE